MSGLERKFGVVLISILAAVATPAVADDATGDRFNKYMLAAVEMLAKERGGRGYNNKSYTQDLKFGNNGELKATQAPYTMCVAAQLETLVEALNLHAAETKDYAAFSFLPKEYWEKLRPTTLRGQIWLVKDANSNGMADALENFGMGGQVTFEQLQPGDVINFNRVSGTGHGVIFLGYLDAKGDELASYSEAVAGFRYFSSQGTATDGGLGYRHAFFHPTCPPPLANGRKRDCGVIRSAEPRLLNMGYVRTPETWSKAKAGQQREQDRAFTRSSAFDGQEFELNEAYLTGETTDN